MLLSVLQLLASTSAHGWFKVHRWVNAQRLSAIAPRAGVAVDGRYPVVRAGSLGDQAVRRASNKAIDAAYDFFGGESFKDTEGIPRAGLNMTIADGYRYVHIKDIHLSDGHRRRSTRVQTVDELMARARAAGFTLVVIAHRSNELARYISEVEMPCRGAADCHARFEKRLCAKALSPTQRFEAERENVRGAIRAARQVGLATMATTFEDIIGDGCGVAVALLKALHRGSPDFDPPVVRCTPGKCCGETGTRRSTGLNPNSFVARAFHNATRPPLQEHVGQPPSTSGCSRRAASACTRRRGGVALAARRRRRGAGRAVTICGWGCPPGASAAVHRLQAAHILQQQARGGACHGVWGCRRSCGRCEVT